ncbi:MAG: YfhO family protein [Eubacterium sp.]|nr:YfhO family protein [Eubacterium sp.]
MDITLNVKKRFATKWINGETVNYSVCFFTVSFLFVLLKQLLKLLFGFSAGISAGVAAGVGAAVLFILENRFVFRRVARRKMLLRLPLYLFRCAVDFGLYKIASFLFGELLAKPVALSFLLSGAVMLFFNYYFDRLLVFDVTAQSQNNLNGRCYRLFFSNRFILFSMLLALLAIGFVFLVFQLFPFGDMTVLRMDLYHQYGPLFTELYDRVTQGKSFLYSWTAGGGTSFLGNYFNYLSSPFSFIILLFDRKDMPYAITAMVAVKGMLAAGTLAYYLKKSLRRHSYTSAAFGVLYAFCGYFLAYYWNIMWLDGMIWLPLIALGIERIIREQKPALYTVSLTVMLYSSYYIGYMLCIFSVIYFFAYFFINGDLSPINPDLQTAKRYSLKKLTNNRLIGSALRFGGASLLAAALCAVTLVPVYFILQATSATSDHAPTTFESYFDQLNLLSSHLLGLETTIRSSGDDVLPNIYCGILSVLLLPLYVANKKIALREKSAYVLLIVFFVFCFNNNWANFIWHALHFPNDLPYRFSFIYCFLIVVIAFRSLMNLRGVAYRDIAFTGMFWVLIVVLYQKFPTNKIEPITIYLSLAFVMLWTAVLLLIKKHRLPQAVLAITVVGVVFSEMIIGGAKGYNFTQRQSDYVQNYDNYTEAIDFIEEHNDSFYRTELTKLVTRMDPCLYGYRGMSLFSSMAYEEYSRNQYNLGMFGNRINSYTYNTQTPLYNMMYGVKYLIKAPDSLQPDDRLYQELYVTTDESTAVYLNRYTLPIAFEVSSDVSLWDNSERNPFDVQSEFFGYATGSDSYYIPVEYTDFYTDNIDCEDITENGTHYFTKSYPDATSGYITVNFTTAADGNLYTYIDSPEIDSLNYYWNDDENSEYQNIKEPYIMDLGYHRKGETVTVTLECGTVEADASYFEMFAYTLDQEALEAAHELLSLGALQTERFSETVFEGTINAGYDGTLYTSIPYDEGWTVTVDGEKAEVYAIGNCQLGADLPAGEHQIVLRYMPKGLRAGALLSGAAYLGLAAWLLIRYARRKFRQNK